MLEENVKEVSNNYNSENKDFRSYSIIAINELYNGNFAGAVENFNKAHSIHGLAYCKFISGDIYEAKLLLNLIKDSSPAVNWLMSLIGIIDDNIEYIPTYIQIRSFYEQDLDILFFYKNNKLAEKILKKNSYLECFNREIYKYSARVLLNYGEMIKSEKLIKKSLDILYNDPETHFLLGELYIKQNKIKEAQKEFSISNNVASGYLPAVKKLKELSNN